MILDATFPPDPRVENEALTLVNQGHQIVLFALNFPANEFAQKETYKGFEVFRYNINRLTYKLSALAYTLPLYKWIMSSKIRKFIKESGVDAIHIHDIQIASSVFSANKTFGLPIVLDLHENRPAIMKYYKHLNKLPGKLLIKPSKWKQKEELFVSKANRTIVVTEEAKKELLSRTQVNSSAIITVPNTVRYAFYEEATFNQKILTQFKDKFVLLYIGNTGERRGLFTALEALRKLIKEIPEVCLLIVGKSSDDSSYQSFVKRNNLEEFVHFAGWQEPTLFPSYIKTAAVCISPLHRNLHHDTTYANKLFQYMSFERPLLVSNAIAQANLVERTNTGLVHEEQNSEDFANKIVQLYKDESLRVRMGANGKSFIENEFCWEKTSETLVALYQNLKD